MIVNSLYPFSAAAPQIKPNALDTLAALNPKNIFRIKSLGLSFQNSSSSLLTTRGKRTQFEESPYDFDTIMKAIDTDSYIKMGFSKYKELFWKEGWDIISENPAAIDYLWQRIDLFEEVMGVSFTSFLSEAADQYIKFANAFIVKARGDIRPLFRGQLETPEGVDPISGFYIIPTETVRIYRDKYNRPVAYKQALDDYEPKNDGNNEPRWSADEVIHLYMDRKPGRAFGTPFIINVLDDVIALRQIEEDVQNLVHRELFPLYLYRVGTEDRPSTPEELENAAAELNNLRVEGGLILPERHDVDVIGAENNALDVTDYIQEFKHRVITGMGLSPHHLGVMNEGGNRAVTDTLDKALYDRVKMFQADFADAVRVHIFNPILREGGFDPMITPAANSSSDRCYFKFREIDIDSQVKKENHFLSLFTGNAISWEELRLKLGLEPEADMNQLLMTMQHQLNVHLAAATATLTPTPPATVGADGKKKPAPKPPDPKNIPNLPNLAKGPGNKDKPQNQFGQKMSPNIRRMDDDILTDIVESLKEEESE
jgi:hypothetical protein